MKITKNNEKQTRKWRAKCAQTRGYIARRGQKRAPEMTKFHENHENWTKKSTRLAAELVYLCKDGKKRKKEENDEK